MCGLTALISSSVTEDEKKLFNELFFLSMLRGRHGSGVFHVPKTGGGLYYKKALMVSDFMQLTTYPTVVKSGVRALLGHARHATMGDRTDQNCHPFISGNVTFFHNGTLVNHRSDIIGRPAESLFDTDSEVLANCISSHDNVKEVLESIRGAYALMWHNAGDGTLNFARNDERTFFLATDQISKSILASSEKEMLELVIARNENRSEFRIAQLPTGNWMQVHLNDNNKVSNTKFVPQKRVAYTAPTYYDGWGRGHNAAIWKKEDAYLERKADASLGSREIVATKEETNYISNYTQNTKSYAGLPPTALPKYRGLSVQEPVFVLPVMWASKHLGICRGYVHRWGFPTMFEVRSKAMKRVVDAAVADYGCNRLIEGSVAAFSVPGATRNVAIDERIVLVNIKNSAKSIVKKQEKCDEEVCGICCSYFYEKEEVEYHNDSGEFYHVSCLDEEEVGSDKQTMVGIMSA